MRSEPRNPRHAPRGRTLVSAAVVCCSSLGCVWADAQSRPASSGAVVADARLVEISGIVASRRHPELYYVHNDSGDGPRVFLIGSDGATRRVINLTGAAHVDYEDIAIAPAAAAGLWDVCVADIGDNAAKRNVLMIYRFREVELHGDAAELSVTPTVFRFAYADGPADAEAFVVHPQTGDGYILTKRLDGRARVYRLAAPWPRDQVITAERVAEVVLPAPQLLAGVVAGADISPDGSMLVVRCLLDGWVWKLPTSGEYPELVRAMSRSPDRIRLPIEPQGESVAFTADGRRLVVLSEGASPALQWVGFSAEGGG